jgi:hypothetical protein
MWALQVAVKTVDKHYVRRTDVAVGDSLCQTVAIGNSTISDLLCPTASYRRR